LAVLDPAREAVAEGIAPIAQNGGATVRISAYEGDLYRARVESPHPSLVRIAVPYFPGWRAEVDGAAAAVVPGGVGLLGVVVPAGSHELVVRYRSNWFATGLWISLVGWSAALAGLVWSVRR